MYIYVHGTIVCNTLHTYIYVCIYMYTARLVYVIYVDTTDAVCCGVLQCVAGVLRVVFVREA